ncbi:family 43 glycosylhydrolase [Lewinella sp. IMCC34183]|uniref:family 43 glycosylhydrolase n=1 Tax=Lewinella sp. IMCC34183 TaxID=2248762 RepID=UPI000E25DF6B|nr:family 43 glycosylhydrolase [Lewinella sp. IMCC34183]
MRYLLLLLLSLPLTAQRTSFTPGGQWLDTDGNHIDAHGGNIIYVDSLETYYWYGEHYAQPRGAACYSSQDLYNWTFEGVVIEKGDIEVFERPKVIYDQANDRYVMWFHYDGDRYSIAELGVAVSDSPTGPFELVDHYRPNGHESRDIGLYFEPDTRRAYIGYAADHVNRTVRMVELSEDYLSVTENDVDIEAHCEGPGILKRNGTFYLLTSQCSGWTPNPATYYTATDSVMGPYTERGHPFVGDAGNNSFNSQPCFIFKIPGYRNAYLYMGDRWNGRGRTESEYVWLPITITEDGEMELHWLAEWDLSLFTPARGR